MTLAGQNFLQGRVDALKIPHLKTCLIPWDFLSLLSPYTANNFPVSWSQACGPVWDGKLDCILFFFSGKMTLAAVSMDAQTVQRNGKRPRGKTKTGDKRGNEKPRQGNWLTRNAYRWHSPHCFVHCCCSHGKRLKGRQYYIVHLF